MDSFYKNDNAAFVDDILGYYDKMKSELHTVFTEVVPAIDDNPNIYVFMVPFDSDVHGLAIVDENHFPFDARDLQLIFGKKWYDMTFHQSYDFLDSIEDIYLEKCKEFGEKSPKFPYVQRLGTIPNLVDVDDITEALKKCIANTSIHLSENAIVSKWIQYGAMIVFFATDFSDARYLRYKADIDSVDKGNLDYKYFLDTIIKNFQDRWCDHIYFGLTYSTIEFLAGTAALIQGSANDVLQERGLPAVDVINRLSNTEYEGSFSEGTLEFFRDYYEEGMVFLSHSICIDNANVKEIRKLLEISTDKICLGVAKDGCRVIGFGKAKDEGVFHIIFHGKNSWELRKDGVSFLKHEKGQYRVPMEPSREDVFSRLKDKFDEFEVGIADIVMAAIKQKHGTMVVVNPNAEQEVSELIREGKGRRLHEVNLIDLIKVNSEIITQMCAIDGALMIDTHGNCEAMGLILPNNGGKKGDPNRGARYNSGKAYADSHKDSFVCVISEDGMVDFF